MAQSVKADAGISVGQIFQGKYRVDAILGFGGMGVVAECTHLHLNERVAIKMLRQDVLLDNDAKARFLREAQAAVKLKSEYVARVSDVGTFENGVPYMVMEFLEGHDLGELLKQRGVLPVQWCVELMLQTAEALCEAHSLGIVHRDVKPTNLFVTWRPDGSALIKVLDFGISKSAAGTDMHLTQTQSLLGTPAYMSPEQMRSARLVDARTDIWSLGTVMYEALEGHRPFEAESFSEMCVKVAVDPPAPMKNTPPGLQQVILKCLAKSPDQRYVSFAELARDLVPYAADPHGAQMLVERMARMLRRANMDWEGGSTGVGRQAVPASTRDIGSGPVRVPPSAPQWGLGSDPSGVAWNAKSDPAGRPWHANTPIPGQPQRGDASQPYMRPSDASQPFARPLGDEQSAGFAGATVQNTPNKSRVGLILLLLLLIAGGAAAFVVVKMSETVTPEPTSNETQPAVAPPTTEPEVAPVKPTLDTYVAKPDDNPGSAAAKPDEQTAETPAKGDTSKTTQKPDQKPDQKPEQKVDKPDPKGEKPDPKIETTGRTGGKSGGTVRAGGGATTTRSGGTTDKTVKTAPPALPPVEDKKPEPPKQPCDPFGAMHGCDK